MKKILYSLLAVFSLACIVGLFSTKKVYTEILIDAPAKNVWQNLTNFSQYPQWNPFITKVAGDLKANSQIDVTIDSSLLGEMDFVLTLAELAPTSEMVWRGQTLFPGLLDGEHSFRIEHISNQRVRFIQEESYTGLLLYPAWLFISADASKGFDVMNKALKNRSEAKKLAVRKATPGS